MANEDNMLQDIEDLEKEGEQEEANALHSLWNLRFNEGCEDDDPALEKLVTEYKEKYGFLDNYFSH